MPVRVLDEDGKIVGIEVTFYSEPVAQQRHRYSARGNFVRAYDPKKSRDYKTDLRTIAQEVYRQRPDFVPFDCALNMMVKTFRSIPKSFSKKKHEEALAGKIRPTTKPDLSNYVKGIEDGLNGILWKDDSLIVSESCHKFYSDQPRIELTVWTLE